MTEKKPARAAEEKPAQAAEEKPAAPKTPQRKAKSIVGVAKEVNKGLWGADDNARAALAKAGFNATAVMAEADRQKNPGRVKSLDELSLAYNKGEFGEEADAIRKLNAQGYPGRLVVHEAKLRSS